MNLEEFTYEVIVLMQKCIEFGAAMLFLSVYALIVFCVAGLFISVLIN